MSIIKHVTLQKIVAHDFRYDPHIRYTLTAHLYLLRKLRNSTATPSFTLYAYMLRTENSFYCLLVITHNLIRSWCLLAHECNIMPQEPSTQLMFFHEYRVKLQYNTT